MTGSKYITRRGRYARRIARKCGHNPKLCRGILLRYTRANNPAILRGQTLQEILGPWTESHGPHCGCGGCND